MDENTKPETVEPIGWKVSDEEIDRIIEKLKEGWGLQELHF